MEPDKPDEGEHAALKAALPRYAAPPGLAEKIRAAAEGQDAPRVSGTRWFFWPSLAAAALVGAVIGTGWGQYDAGRRDFDAAAISAHIRSLEAGHLTDVLSTDQHTVKPWFAGKVDFSPPVEDLTSQGYPLAGGRLDRLGNHAAAALVFRHGKHVLNLFVWPGKPEGRTASSEDGFHTLAWADGDFAFLAVSDIPAPELEQFKAAYQAAERR